MPFSIVRNNIASMWTDCIVCPTDSDYSGLGGADHAIHLAAGEQLDEACRSLPTLSVGSVTITRGYNLPVRYILHTMGPVWIDGEQGESESLAACYNAVLTKAATLGMQSISIPLISSGTYRFPKDQVLRIALDAVSRFLLDHEMMIYIVVYDKSAYSVSKKLMSDIKAYIDDTDVDETEDQQSNNRYSLSLERKYERRRRPIDEFDLQQHEKGAAKPAKPEEPCCSYSIKPDSSYDDMFSPSASEPRPIKVDAEFFSVPSSSLKCTKKDKLKKLIDELDEGFSDALLRLIDEKHMTDVECYKKANIDKKLFSKIRSNRFYRPSKPTVLAFAISLELDLEETESLLKKAGYALSPSIKFDRLIQFFIENHIYDIVEINMVLFSYDQPCLGNVVA